MSYSLRLQLLSSTSWFSLRALVQFLSSLLVNSRPLVFLLRIAIFYRISANSVLLRSAELLSLSFLDLPSLDAWLALLMSLSWLLRLLIQFCMSSNCFLSFSSSQFVLLIAYLLPWSSLFTFRRLSSVCLLFQSLSLLLLSLLLLFAIRLLVARTPNFFICYLRSLISLLIRLMSLMLSTMFFQFWVVLPPSSRIILSSQSVLAESSPTLEVSDLLSLPDAPLLPFSTACSTTLLLFSPWIVALELLLV